MAKQPESVDYTGYGELLHELKQCIQTAKVKAALAVNKEMVHLYWQIGRRILQKMEEAEWGDKVLEGLSRDLRAAFPGSKGYSARSLLYMKQFAGAYPEFAQQAAAQIPWGHNMLILDKLDDPVARQWYAAQTIENGWSRNVLSVLIENKLYERQGKALTNFKESLPPPQSDLAQQVLKDPYCFDFLTLREGYIERELEQGLIDQVQNTLLELGAGFSLVGRQHHLEVEGSDYYMDLLFYHLKLRCYCVVELKATEFKPEYAGKLNFYLSAVDDLIRHPDDKPTIGMLLCKGKGSLKVEYALRGMSQPMGVSSYLVKTVEELEASLPSREELAAKLGIELGDESVSTPV